MSFQPNNCENFVAEHYVFEIFANILASGVFQGAVDTICRLLCETVVEFSWAVAPGIYQLLPELCPVKRPACTTSMSAKGEKWSTLRGTCCLLNIRTWA